MLGRFLERYLLVWLLVLSGMALFWPHFCTHVGVEFDPFLKTAQHTKGLFAVTMFFIGWLLPRDELQQVARRWPKVLGGTCVQYLSMPLLAVCWSYTLGLRDEWLWGSILVGCVPGAMASNVLTLAARGNVSYSLSLTTLATLVSPVFVPLVLKLALGRNAPLSVRETSFELCWMVVLPVVSGHVLTRVLPNWQWIGQRIGPVIANFTILWIIAVVVAANRGRLLLAEETSVSQYARLIVTLLAINLSGYLAGAVGARLLRLDTSMRRALVLEIGMQNAGLGTVLATGTLFPEHPAAAVPPALYTFGCMLTGTALARWWARGRRNLARETV
jgi:BASS family bile acid:Na+ symporter